MIEFAPPVLEMPCDDVRNLSANDVFRWYLLTRSPLYPNSCLFVGDGSARLVLIDDIESELLAKLYDPDEVARIRCNLRPEAGKLKFLSWSEAADVEGGSFTIPGRRSMLDEAVRTPWGNGAALRRGVVFDIGSSELPADDEIQRPLPYPTTIFTHESFCIIAEEDAVVRCWDYDGLSRATLRVIYTVYEFDWGRLRRCLRLLDQVCPALPAKPPRPRKLRSGKIPKLSQRNNAIVVRPRAERFPDPTEADAPARVGKPPAPHVRRGHLRRLRSGKIVKIKPASVRGGIIPKDYRIGGGS